MNSERSLDDNDFNYIAAESCRQSFYEFVQEFWDVIIKEKPVWNWHIKYLCDELQIVTERIKSRQPKEYDLVINIPPGTTKSTIVTIMHPVWAWTVDPTIRFITGSYSGGLSTEHAVKSRDILRSDKFKRLFPEITAKEDSDGKTGYENNFTGSRTATSVGGTITGKHAHIITVDDPLNPNKASSEAERKTANNWMDHTLSTRKVDKSITVTILMMQRLHASDCTGHVLSKKGKRIKHICLPAELSDNVKPAELKANYVAGLLDPVRLGPLALAEARTDLGSYGYSGQMAQLPSPDEGGILKKHWFGIITWDEFIKEQGKKLFVWDFFIDSAFTKKTKNDPSALMSVARIGNDVFIRESAQVWLEFPAFCKFIPEFTKRNGYSFASRIYIEPKASGLSVLQQIKDQTGLSIIALDHTSDDKEAYRAPKIHTFRT